MKNIKTANILLIALLVIVVIGVTMQLFVKDELPSADGKTKIALQKSLFGMNLTGTPAAPKTPAV